MTVRDLVPPFRAPVVLLVDDDADALEMYTIGLRACGFDVLSAADADQAMTLASVRDPDIVVTDAHLDGRCGVDLTGDLALGEARRPRPYDSFLAKPCTPQRLARELLALVVPRVPALEQ